MKQASLLLLCLLLFPAYLSAQIERCEYFNELGDSLLNLGHYDQAIDHYRKAEAEDRRLGRPDLAATTLSNQGVAYRLTERLCLSENTIEYHRKRMMRKLGTDNVVELILRAQRQGFLKPDLHHPPTE